jgi:hypothetical protein
MAESTIAGDYESKCSVVPMVLSEGTITVTARAYSSRGSYETVATFASELRKGDPIAYAAGEKIEYEDTGGLGMATRISNSRPFRGRIVSEPRWISSPPTTAGTYPSLSLNVGNKYYRIADVELWGVTKVHAVKHTLAGRDDILCGSSTGMCVSAASSYASHKVCIEDLDYGGAPNSGFMSLTYRKNSTAGTAYTHLIASPTGIQVGVHT